MEIWKDIAGFEGIYLISNKGRVASNKSKLILKTNINKHGYERITINSKSFLIHRIVMRSFRGKSDLEVNHINSIKTDNNLSNLEYCTRSENISHAYMVNIMSNVGEKNPNCKINESIAREIKRRIKTGKYLVKDLAYMYNISLNTVSKIKNNRSWKNVKI